ncbi:ABC transporter ATP-binding protein [Allostreptomyces psammosilenae]|nr:ABC transporter ATP-binding protein [Allostreptomyces psammosilenae]
MPAEERDGDRGGRRRGTAPPRYVAAVTDATLDLLPGEVLALVGESGCGKSVMAGAVLGLLPGNAEIAGAAMAGGIDLTTADERTLARRVRGRLIGLVPQSPGTHLTPVRTIRAQLEEAVRELHGLPRRTPRGRLREEAERAADRAWFPLDHLDAYPHELSGGLAQRAATALALVGDAPVLLADEPTTGLDRPLVERTVDQLRLLADQGRGVLIVTHDLAAAERVADRIAVMYAGRIVEVAQAREFFAGAGPRHPYAAGLLDALPSRAFTPIAGMPPELSRLPGGCAFAARCAHATDVCREGVPALLTPSAPGPAATGTGTVPAAPASGAVACHHPLGAPAARPRPKPPAEDLEPVHD